MTTCGTVQNWSLLKGTLKNKGRNNFGLTNEAFIREVVLAAEVFFFLLSYK